MSDREPAGLQGRPRILVVDDDRQMVATFQDVLEVRGWATEGAYSGEEALARVERDSFDVVLMDIRMSGLNGVDALAAIKRRRPGMPVVLMTAYSAPELLDRARGEGAAEVIAKPVPLDRLMETLGRVVGTRASVLVVDNDVHFLQTTVELLDLHGYRVRAARDLSEVERVLSEEVPSVVLLDLRLDGTHPAEAVRTIRQLAPEAQIVLCSGDPASLDATSKRFSDQGVVASFLKPFSPDELVRTVETLSNGG